jgi:hypothetical protein
VKIHTTFQELLLCPSATKSVSVNSGEYLFGVLLLWPTSFPFELIEFDCSSRLFCVDEYHLGPVSRGRFLPHLVFETHIHQLLLRVNES